ncbi:unnamed protein product [Caenorhabditis auriculariae]|uniref:Uncharacterized protein n=1 Tax=Caenorhabditis auriculariae TaxID=2777116 RepID=A0A8S1GNP0_9PELO|nr:unnamed protein product [Caenorhabditis auriculariae]
MVVPSPYRTAIIDCVKSGMTNSEIVKKLKVSRFLMTSKEGDFQSPSRLQKPSKPFERKSDALRKEA